jgi:hypothetical protein
MAFVRGAEAVDAVGFWGVVLRGQGVVEGLLINTDPASPDTDAAVPALHGCGFAYTD